MKATFRLVDPNACNATITITAPVAEWRRLREQLSNSEWPAWNFRALVSRVIEQAEAHLDATQEYES